MYGRAGAGASMLRGRAVEAALLHCNDVDAKPTDALIAHALRHQGCPHRCLGVAPNCQAAAVRKRFLSLARRLHPDKTDHPSARLRWRSARCGVPVPFYMGRVGVHVCN